VRPRNCPYYEYQYAAQGKWKVRCRSCSRMAAPLTLHATQERSLCSVKLKGPPPPTSAIAVRTGSRNSTRSLCMRSGETRSVQACDSSPHVLPFSSRYCCRVAEQTYSPLQTNVAEGEPASRKITSNADALSTANLNSVIISSRVPFVEHAVKCASHAAALCEASRK